MTLPLERPLTVVLVLDHAFVSGGQSKVAFDSAIGLKKFGHEPIVFAAVGPIEPELEASGIRVVCLGQNDLIGHPSPVAAALQGIWNTPAERALAELLATLPADRTVVHVHGWAKALSPSIARPIAASRLPAVYTMHEYFLLCPNGGFYNYKSKSVCHLDPLSARCWMSNCDSRSYTRKLWRNVRSVAVERIAHLPAVFSDIVCISHFQLDAVGHRLPAGARIHLVSNPIAAVDLGPKPEPATGDIMFIGRISPEKGALVFAEAARRLGRVPVFVGDGPARPELASLYPEARILGWHDREAVGAWMRRAKALVFPSLWYEGQPLTVLEALSAGTPVLVSDGCAGRDSVENEVSGLWFRSGDPDDLARAMARLDDDAEVARLSNNAYASFWADPPTLERHTRAILGIYRDLVASAPATEMRAA